MVSCGHGAADTVGSADGPVLVEGRGAEDGGLVGSDRKVDVVGSAVGFDAAHVRGTGGRVVVADSVGYVVFDEGIGGPAVDGEVGVAVVDWGPGAAILNCHGTSWIPSFAGDEITGTVPGHAVSTAGIVGVGDWATVVSVEGVVVAVVGSSSAAG